MANTCESLFYLPQLTPLLELAARELGAIIRNEEPWEPKAEDYVAPNEGHDSLLSDGADSFSLNPLRVILHGHYDELLLACAGGEGADNIQSPLIKGASDRYWDHGGCGLVWYVSMFLAIDTSLRREHRIFG